MSGERVHWLSQALGQVPADDDWLTARERATLAGFSVVKRRSDWRLGRWTAKRAVASHLHLGDDPLCTIEIVAAPNGAPEARVAGAPAALVLSISHAGGIGLCAVGALGMRLGCDVETVEPRDEAWTADFFTPEEQARIARMSSPDRERVATLLWSAKESALKALREGLRRDTRTIVIADVEADVERGDPTTWEPITARDTTSGVVFGVWWRTEADRVMTIAAAPSAAPPIDLR